MHFKVIAASLLASAGLSTAAPLEARQDATCPVVQQGDYVWKLDNLNYRKLDGKTITAFSFNIQATNGGTLDFDCSYSGPVEEKHLYECGPNSGIYFSYQEDRSGLVLRHGVSDDIRYVGTVTLPTYCRAGGAGTNDRVCQGVSPSFITLVQIPDGL